MLLSLALSFAERRKPQASMVAAAKAHPVATALPAAFAGAALAASLASSLGLPLPKCVSDGNDALKAHLLAVLARFDSFLHGEEKVKAEPDAHPASEEGTVAKKPQKVRILAFDSIRFFLISYIVCGHFISFADPSQFAFRAITQINVVVGAFFALSGYVSAYTTTELQERKASAKLLKTPSPKWILQKIFAYYPLHLLILTIFSPMFLYSDVHFSGWPTAIFDGLLEVTLSQAWFPMHAEVWNAPTWFLSALSYATVVLRFALPELAKQTKNQLGHSMLFLFLAGLLPKLGYCDDHHAWGLLEGAMPANKMPNLAIFNTQRFNPFYAAIEVLMGAAACRMVMLDDAPGEEPAPKTNAWSTLLPLLGMIDIILLRARGRLHISDVLTRSCIFIPLFLKFMMSAHRASVNRKAADIVVKALEHPLLITLGNLSFPIFVVHGPVGQLFYKKVIASKLFGGPLNKKIGPQFFYIYLASCVAAAWVLQKTFLNSKKVSEASTKAVDKISAKI
jgi:peptidoglycan/LPS O-acetylase OafA/YrhL